MLLADGFNDAIIGTGERAGQPTIVVYDFDRCVAILCERDNMGLDDAVEYMYYNVIGAWVGEETPLFVKRVNSVEDLTDVD
jgi:hypothetical protein